MPTLPEIKAKLTPESKAYYSFGCCWWTTNPEDLGERPESRLPCCPYCGSVLMQAPAADFIASAEANASHYGAGGLDTFARAHGVPCQHVKRWEHYTMMDASGAFAGVSEIRFPRQKRELPTEKSIRCTRCGSEFSEAETEGAKGCPTCGSTGLPMRISDDVTVRINWHELRILGIWAHNWALQCDQRDPDAGEVRGAVEGILGRLQAQHPDRSPLTLPGEIAQLREVFPQVEILDAEGQPTDDEPKKPN